jgi:hypothetical protein
MKEDRLTNQLIKIWRRESTEINPEAHYNHYGTRGVADLHIHEKIPRAVGYRTKSRIYEVKSNPQNANEVVRQFNKMCQFFYKDQRHKRPDNVRFELTFVADKSNLEHVYDNKEIYRAVAEESNNVLTFRHPDNIKPVPIFADTYEIGDEEWSELVKRQGHEENLEQLKQVIEVE